MLLQKVVEPIVYKSKMFEEKLVIQIEKYTVDTKLFSYISNQRLSNQRELDRHVSIFFRVLFSTYQSYVNLVKECVVKSPKNVPQMYRTRAIISRGLYFFYPFFTAAAGYIAEQPLFLDSFFGISSIIFKRNCTLNDFTSV